MAKVLTEGDTVLVKTIVPNYQLGASNIEIQYAEVVTSKVEPLNRRERVVDFFLGNRVRIQFTGNNFVTLVRSRCIVDVVPPETP